MIPIENLPPIPIDYIEEYIRISNLCKEDVSVLNELIKHWQCDFSVGYMALRIMKTKEMGETE